MGSILSSVGVPNGMIPKIILTAERILGSPGDALSAGVFLCRICSNYIVRTTSLTTSSWHALSNGVISRLKSFPLGILLTICVRFKYEDLYYLWCEALDKNVEITHQNSVARSRWSHSHLLEI
jgi:hypothetical protein